MRTAKQIANVHVEARNQRVQDNHGEQLNAIMDALLEDATSDFPKGHVVTTIRERALATAARDGEVPDLVWFLNGLGYRVSYGHGDARTQSRNLYVYWR